MTDLELDALFGPEDSDSNQTSKRKRDSRRQAGSGPSAAARRLLAQGQMGQKTRQFY
mgnify:FL=1